MKKELLMASALVSTMGLAGVAEAASATMSGHTRVGVTGTDLDSGGDSTYGGSQLSTFAVSISETTDSGIKISTGFDLTNESDGATDPSGLTLTFTDGSKLDLIEAGNASSSHAVGVPGASGEQGVTNSSLNAAPTALTMGDTSDSVGFEYHTAADAFGVEGLKAGVSASFNSDAAKSSDNTTAVVESAYAVGVTYVTDAGDSTVTVGGGVVSAEFNNSNLTKDTEVFNIGLTAVTGDLTVGVGYASGDFVRGGGTGGRSATQVDSAQFTSAGVKYVSGDITFAVGITAGEGVDEAPGTAATSGKDSTDTASGSIDYAVASGVTATLGYTDVSTKNEASSTTGNAGSSWYVGATVSF